MLSPKEVVEKYPKEVDEFFRVTFALSDEETAALEHVVPMTQELFESCYEKLMSVECNSFKYKTYGGVSRVHRYNDTKYHE